VTRYMLVVSHSSRAEAAEASVQVIQSLLASEIIPVVAVEQKHLFGKATASLSVLNEEVNPHDVELAIVLGGDGTILLAAELLRGTQAPLLGVNLGHVGFLAESERDDLAHTVERAIAREYDVDERLALDVVVTRGGSEIFHTWALNEATVEKAGGVRMIELVLEVDGRPVSSFGCDGVVLSTPTGSTAYSFSAGGPVVWPQVKALLMVPLSAHALFSRPLVVDPESTLAVEVAGRVQQEAVLWCDGRRSCELTPGSRVSVTQSSDPVRLARLHPAPFSDRLVRKFALPVTGWRGPDGSPS
jgi:NAD+ kinase